MDWESVLNHVERMRQLDSSSEEEEDSKAEERKRKDEESGRDKERKLNEKKKHLIHTDSTETQSTRLSENSLNADDESNTEPFTVMDTVREEEEEDAKRRRRESSMLSESTVRWKLISLVMSIWVDWIQIAHYHVNCICRWIQIRIWINKHSTR